MLGGVADEPISCKVVTVEDDLVFGVDWLLV